MKRLSKDEVRRQLRIAQAWWISEVLHEQRSYNWPYEAALMKRGIEFPLRGARYNLIEIDGVAIEPQPEEGEWL